MNLCQMTPNYLIKAEKTPPFRVYSRYLTVWNKISPATDLTQNANGRLALRAMHRDAYGRGVNTWGLKQNAPLGLKFFRNLKLNSRKKGSKI